MDRRGIRAVMIGAAAVALLGFALPAHRADIKILTADERDLAPHRMQAVVDLGLFAVSVLVTWSAQITR